MHQRISPRPLSALPTLAALSICSALTACVAGATLAGCGGSDAPKPAPPTSPATQPAGNAEDAAEKPPTAAELREEGAQLIYRTLDPAGALRVFEQVRALEPKDPEVHQILAILFADLGDFPDALTAADANLTLLPRTPAPLDLRAEIRLLSGDLDGAAADFRAALALDERFFNARMGLVAVHGYRGEWDQALAEVEHTVRAAQTPEEKLRAGLARGFTLLAAGRTALAAAALQEATHGAPRRAALLAVELAIETEKWTEASAAVISTLATLPEGPDDNLTRWLRMLHVVAASRGDARSVAQSQLWTLELGADQLEPWITKDLSFARGHLALANEDYNLAVAAFTSRWVTNHMSLYDPGRANPGPSYNHFSLKARLLTAEALARAGRVEEARALLERIARTYHRGIAAVAVHQQARRALAKLPAASAAPASSSSS